MTEQKVIEMSKKQMSISDKVISNEEPLGMKDSLVIKSATQQGGIQMQSLNDFGNIKGQKSPYLNSSTNGNGGAGLTE